VDQNVGPPDSLTRELRGHKDAGAGQRKTETSEK